MRRVRGKSVQSVKSSVLSCLFLRAMSIAGIVGCCRVGKTRKLSVGLPTSHDFFFFFLSLEAVSVGVVLLLSGVALCERYFGSATKIALKG